MKPSQHARFNQGLKQGKIYEIEVFEVSENEHNFRPNTAPFKITFNKETNFCELEADMPEYSFNLMKISDILQMPANVDLKHLIGELFTTSIQYQFLEAMLA